MLVSVRNAIVGTDLSQLRKAVEKEFLTLDENEQRIRSVMAKLESGLVRRLAEFKNELTDRQIKPLIEEPILARQVGEKAKRKIKAQRNESDSLAWFRHDGAYRLVCSNSNIAWRGTWPLAGQKYPVSFSWTLTCLSLAFYRLLECMALGGQGT